MVLREHRCFNAKVIVVITITACSRSDPGQLDSAVASVAKASGAAEQSAGLVTPYPPAGDSAARWSFDSMPTGKPPTGFLFGRTGDGTVGHWIVQPAADAPSHPNVLVQTDTDRTRDRFPVAVVDAQSLRDVALSVRCKPISGKVDQACGLVFRYLDENNYLVTRANAIEGNVRLYTVKGGRRREIASWRGSVTRGDWHTIEAKAVGDQIEVSWDGQLVISKRDETFMGAGRFGLWLKADSYTQYDDLTARPLAGRGAAQ